MMLITKEDGRRVRLLSVADQNRLIAAYMALETIFREQRPGGEVDANKAAQSVLEAHRECLEWR